MDGTKNIASLNLLINMKHFLSTYCVPSPVLGSVGDMVGTETAPGSPLRGLTVQRGTQTCRG